MIRRAEQLTRESYLSPPILGALAIYQISLWIAQNDFQAIALWEQGHARIIFDKLQVQRRTEATARAPDLGLS